MQNNLDPTQPNTLNQPNQNGLQHDAVQQQQQQQQFQQQLQQPVEPGPQFQPGNQFPANNMKKKFPTVKVIIGAAVLGVVAALIFIIPAIFNNLSNSTLASDNVLEPIFKTDSFFLEKDNKYALVDFKNEKRLTEYEFTSVTPFIYGTALVSKDREHGIIKDDGSMLVDFSTDIIVRSGTLYGVNSGPDRWIIDYKGNNLLEGYSLVSTSSTNANRLDSRDININPIVQGEDGVSLMSLDGKTEILKFNDSSRVRVSDNYNYGNYTTIRTNSLTAIINNRDKKLVSSVDLNDGQRLVFRASSDFVNNGGSYSHGLFKDVFVAKLDTAGYGSSGLLGQSVNNIVSGETMNVGDQFVIRGSEVVYSKTGDECNELYTVVFPGSGSEDVVCRKVPRISSSTDKKNTYSVLGSDGSQIAEGIQFYDAKNYIALGSDGESLEFYVDGSKVHTQESPESAVAVSAEEQNTRPFFWSSNADHRYYVVAERYSTIFDKSYSGRLVLYNLDGSVADTHDLSGAASYTATANYDTEREEIFFSSNDLGRYKVQEGKLTLVQPSDDDPITKYDMKYEAGPLYGGYQYVGGVRYDGLYSSHDKEEGVFRVMHNDSLVEISLGEGAMSVTSTFNRGQEPMYFNVRGPGLEQPRAYYLSGKRIE